MNTSCQNCRKGFEVYEKDLVFYKKMNVPSPTHCPWCRMQRRLAFRNDRTLYKSKSALSGKELITMYNPESGYTIYDQEEWWGDSWDPLEYGRDFDFSRPFFEQFAELQKVVPRFNLFNLDTENCDFVNYAPHCKNSYLLFGSWFDEDCMYGQTLNECVDCVDNLFLDKSELCYENVDCNDNYASHYCQNSSNLVDSYLCFDSSNLKNCIGCWNLKNKEYHIFNKPVSKEEFEAEKAKFAYRSYVEEFKKRFRAWVKTEAIHRDFIGQNNENVSGDFIFNSRNADHCFSVYRSQDVAYCGRMFDQKDTYDFDGGGKGELLYENMSNDFSNNSIGCTTSEKLVDTHYSDLCFNCTDCFGCAGLRYKKYCIFNKQYTKEEYEVLVAKIIEHMKAGGEWGEFFPVRFSQFAYNETMVQEYFPITKEEALQKGWGWIDEKEKFGGTVSTAPDNIGEVTSSILDDVFGCEQCTKHYKITAQELAFYKKQGIPVPAKCHDCRHKNRMAMRNPRQICDGECFKCKKSVKTSYALGSREKIYCEECYLGEIY